MAVDRVERAPSARKPSRATIEFGRVDLLLILVSLIWGVNITVLKLSLGDFSPLSFNAIRFTIASSLLYLAARATHERRRIPRKDFTKLSALGFFGSCLYQIAFIEGVSLTLAGNVALIVGATPVFTTVLSALVGHERIGRLCKIGVATSFLGVVAIVLAGGKKLGFSGAMLGDLLIFSCTVMWAVYTVNMRPLVVKYGYMECTRLAMLAGAVPLVLFSVPSLMSQSWGAIRPVAWIGLLYSAGAAIALAYVLWNYAAQRIGNTRASAYSNLTPVIGVLVAWLALGEVPAAGQLLGMAAIFLGVFLTRMDRKSFIEEEISLSCH